MKNFTARTLGRVSGFAVLMSAALFFVHSCKEQNLKEATDLVPKTDVIVVEKPQAEETPRRIIYLTFDDGPNRGTKNLLKIVQKRKIPVTAFVVAQHIYDSESQKKDFEALQNDSLVELANHSFSHAENKYSEFYKNPAAVTADFKRATDSLRFPNSYVRTPGRNIWRTGNIISTDIHKSSEAADALAKSGFKIIGWDLEWKQNGRMQLDGTHKEMFEKIDSMFRNDLEKTPRHLVLLTHDQYLRDEKSFNELDHLIERLQKDGGFEFRKISQYPRINEVFQ